MAFDPTSATIDADALPAGDPGPDHLALFPDFDPATAQEAPAARLTVYTRFDDPGMTDGRTAAAHPDTGKSFAEEGVTIAVDPKVIPYGSKVRIPYLAQFSKNKDGIFTAHDTGRAVKDRKASGGNEPVIDVYVGGADERQAKQRRDALAKALGTEPIDYEVINGRGFDPATAQLDTSGKGRFSSAMSTLGQTAEAGAGQALEGAAGFAREIGAAVRGDSPEGGWNEVRGLESQVRQLHQAPDFTGKEQILDSHIKRIGLLRSTLTYDAALAPVEASGKAVAEHAQQFFQPNPQYKGEFFADTLPQVAGSAVESVAPFVVGGPVAGVAAMFGQTYQQTLEENRAKGVEEETAVKRALLNGIVSGGLESVGEGIVVGALGRIAKAKAAKGVAGEVGKAVLSEGVTGASQEAAQETIDQEKLDWGEIAKQGALEALGGLIISGPVAGAKAIIDRRGQAAPVQERTAGTEATEAPAAPVQDLAGDIGNLSEETPEIAPIGTTEPSADAGTAAAPLIDETTAEPIISAEPVAPVPADEATRKRLVRDFSFPAGLADEVTVDEAADILQYKPGSRQAETAVQNAMSKTSARQKATAAPSEAVDEVDIPFSQQPAAQSSVGEDEQQRIKTLMREAWRATGVRQGPEIIVVNDASEIPPPLAGERVRAAVASGSVVEAYFLSTKAGERRIVLVRDGAATVAAQRGMTLEARVQQLALHELVHHYGSVGALLPKTQQRKYNAIVDGVIARLQREDAALLQHLTTPKEAGGYGYDLSNAASRAAIAEEYLARFNETATGAPGWVQRAIAQIRDLLRAAFPNLKWSDNDLRTLLDLARHRVVAGSDNVNGVRFSLNAEQSRQLDELYAGIAPLKAGFDAKLKDVAREIGGRTKLADLKTRERSEQKVTVDYNGNVSQLKDVLRGTVIASTPAQLQQALADIGKRFPITRVSDRFAKPNGHGYRDILVNVDAGGGHIAEIQIHTPTSLAAKEAVHKLYKVWRTLDPQSEQARALDAQMTKTYADAAAGDAVAATSASNSAGVRSSAVSSDSERSLPNSRLGPNEQTQAVQPSAEGTSATAAPSRSKNFVPSGKSAAVTMQADTATPEKRRQFIQKVKDSAAVAPQIKQRVESLYSVLSDKTAIDAAKSRVNEIGIEAAEREILATGPNNPPTKWTNVLGLELMGRLQTSGEYERAAAIAVHIAENNTSQAQAIQAMALFARLGPDGIQYYAANLVRKAIAQGGLTPETLKLYEQIEKLKAELAKSRKSAATSAVLNVQDALKAGGFTAEKLGQLQGKLRQALMQSGSEPGNARDRITGILVAAGMKPKPARRLAERAVAEAQRAMKLARDRALRGMLRWKQGLPASPVLETAIQTRIREAMIANPGSIWGRYRAQAARQLGNLAALMADPGLRVQTPALQDFTARLLSQLTAQLPAEARPKTERDAVGLLSEAVNNAEKYREVWNEARRYVAEKYRANPQMLDRLDKIVGHMLERPFSETTMQGAIDQSLKSLETSVRDLLLRSHLDKTVARTQLVSLIAERVGVGGDQARQLGADIMGAYDRAEAKARDAYAKGLFKDPLAKVSKGDLQRWMEMNNAGVLDDAKFYANIARKYGLPVFTDVEARRIADLQRQFEQASDGDAKLVAGARMMDTIHSLVPAGLWAKVSTIRNMAMLLNPKTMIRNIMGNQVLFLTDVAADTINGWVIDPLLAVATGQRARTGGSIVTRISGLAQPWHDFWAGVASGKTEGHTGRLQLFGDGLAYLRDLGRLTQHGIWDTRDFSKAFRHTFSSRVGRLFEDGLSVALGAADRAFHASAFQGSLQAQMRAETANGRETLAPTPEILEQALIDANRAVLQDDNVVSSMLLKIKRGMNVIGLGKPIDAKTGKAKLGEPGTFGLGSVVIPFGQVPGAVIARGIEFSPLGFIRAGYELLAPHIGHSKAFDQKAFGEAFSRALVGTGGMALGAWLLRLGVLSALPDDDKDLEAMRRASGLGGMRVNVSELWRRLLALNFNTPASMSAAAQDGDVIVSYDWLQPAAFTVAAGAQASVEQQHLADTAKTGRIPSTSSAMIAGLLGSVRGFEHMSVLAGIKRFSQTTGQRESVAQAIVEQGVTLPASFIPTAVKDLNSLFDNTLRETRADPARHPIDAAVNAVLERIPGAGTQFPPRYDVFGQAIERYQAAGNTLFNVFLNPAFTSEVRQSPEARELERIYDATLEGSVTPASRDRIVTINGRQRELTNEELAHFKYFTGQVATSRLREFLAAPAWARLPESVRAKYAAGAFSDAGSAGKILLFGDRPKQPGRQVIRAAVQARAMGLERRPWE